MALCLSKKQKKVHPEVFMGEMVKIMEGRKISDTRLVLS